MWRAFPPIPLCRKARCAPLHPSPKLQTALSLLPFILLSSFSVPVLHKRRLRAPVKLAGAVLSCRQSYMPAAVRCSLMFIGSSDGNRCGTVQNCVVEPFGMTDLRWESAVGRRRERPFQCSALSRQSPRAVKRAVHLYTHLRSSTPRFPSCLWPCLPSFLPPVVVDFDLAFRCALLGLLCSFVFYLKRFSSKKS